MLDPRFRRLVRILTEGCTRAGAYERLYAGHDACLFLPYSWKSEAW
jgi:hypothetical protein